MHAPAMACDLRARDLGWVCVVARDARGECHEQPRRRRAHHRATTGRRTLAFARTNGHASSRKGTLVGT